MRKCVIGVIGLAVAAVLAAGCSEKSGNLSSSDPKERAQAIRAVTRPTLLALAEKDRIIDNAATRTLVEAMPCSRRRVIVYPGAGHTLEFEPDPAAYFRALVAWIEEVEAA